MTYLQTMQLTADGRRTAKINDLNYRILKLSEQAHAAQPGSEERKTLRALGAKLIAERNELRRG